MDGIQKRVSGRYARVGWLVIALAVLSGCDRESGDGSSGQGAGASVGLVDTKGGAGGRLTAAEQRAGLRSIDALREAFGRAGTNPIDRARMVSEAADRLGPGGSMDELQSFRANLALAGASEEEIRIGTLRYLHRWSEGDSYAVWKSLVDVVRDGEEWLTDGLKMSMRGYVAGLGFEAAADELARLESAAELPQRLLSEFRSNVAAQSILEGSANLELLARLSKAERVRMINHSAEVLGNRLLAGQMDVAQVDDVLRPLSGADLRRAVLSEVIKQAAAARDSSRMAALFDRARREELDEVCELAAIEYAAFDPAGVTEWFGGIEHVPPLVVSRIAESRTAASPSEALQWALDLPNSDLREHGLEAVVSEWTRQDARAAAEAIGALSPGSDRDSASSGLVRFLHRKGAHAEAQEWLEFIDNPTLRESLREDLGY